MQLKVSYLDEDQIFKGDVLGPREAPVPISQVIEAELELLELLKPIFSKGSMCMMHIHTYADEISVKDIVWAREKDPNTGEEVKKEMPKYTRNYAKCLVRLAMKTPIPVEKISECAALGRFTLRDEGKTIAVGRVTRYIPFNKDRAAIVRAAAANKAAAAEGSAGADKHAPVVFNMETGETEAQKPALEGIAEDEEEKE